MVPGYPYLVALAEKERGCSVKRLMALLALAMPLVAQRSGSIGLTGSEAGLGLTIAYTGQNQWGIFGGGGGATRKDEDLPAEANFYWVNYNKTEWKDKTWLFIGPAYRLGKNAILGVGYSYYKQERYEFGPSTATGLIFRRPIPDKTQSGPIALLDFGSTNGIGGQVFAAPGLVGGGISWRFNR